MEMSTIVSLLVVVLFAGIFVYKIFTDYKDAKKLLLSLVLEAEKRWSEKGSGSLKYSYVVGQVKSWMPILIRPFFPDRVLDVLIDEALDFIKDQLDCSEDEAEP